MSRLKLCGNRSLTISDKKIFRVTFLYVSLGNMAMVKYFNVICKKLKYSDFTVVEIKHTILYN
jgi:hypothetical protein